MTHVAHQTIVMQFILELAKTLERDPRACVRAFFSRCFYPTLVPTHVTSNLTTILRLYCFFSSFFNARISMAEQTYKDAFNDELDSFKRRVKKRAEARIEEAMKQVEEVSTCCLAWLMTSRTCSNTVILLFSCVLRFRKSDKSV